MLWFSNYSLQLAEEYRHNCTEFHRDESLPIILTFIAELEDRPYHCSDSWMLASDHTGPGSSHGALIGTGVGFL
jgi:hypothetical protein